MKIGIPVRTGRGTLPRRSHRTFDLQLSTVDFPIHRRGNPALGSDRLAVAERVAGFRRVVVPEPQRLKFFLLRPYLIQGVALEEFAIFHDPANGVRVVNVLEGIFVEDQQGRRACRLDRAKIIRPAEIFEPFTVAQRSTSSGVMPPLASIHISQ